MSTKPIQSYHEGAYKSLMKGLKELDFRSSSVPCDLVLTGDQAFPLAINSEGQVLVAASQYGHGRIVVLAHETYLTTFPALVENALIWLRGDGSDNLSVGVQEYVKAVADNLSKSSFQAKVVGAFSDKLGVGVYVTDAYSAGAKMKELVAFLKAGGGVLIGGQAWHWATQNPKANAFLQFPGNKVSGVAGIYFSTAYGGKEVLPVQPQIPSSLKTLRAGKDFEDDLKVLHQGISEFDLGGDMALSKALVHGPLAFPIGTTKDGQTFLAGSYYGKGRVIVITHEKLLTVKTLTSFWTNAIDWLDQGRKGVVGVVPGLKLANKSGLKFEETKLKKDLSVFVCTAWSDDHAEEIQDFVAEGGGLLIGGHVWYWALTHFGGNPMTETTGNKILNRMGLSLSPEIIGEGSYKTPVPSQAMKDTIHFRHLLRRFAGHVIKGDKLTEHEEKNLKQLGMECTYFLKMEALDSYSYIYVLSVLTDILKFGMPQVSEKNPVKTPKDHLLLRAGPEVYKVSPDRDALLPYLIKDLPSLPLINNQRIRINVNTAGEEWISTGLYLSPGMKTEIIIPAEIVNKDWKIQIGCQSDTLNHDELKRAPHVVERFPVTMKKMQVWNMWGGLIYLVAPPNTKVEGAEVIVQQAISAPYYKSGVSTSADWSSLGKAPAPWAEMEFDNIILTVPSDFIRDLEKPEEVEALWNEIMKGVADLAVIPQKLPRKERIVADVQISAGGLHAGYPVMMHTYDAGELFRVNDAKTKGLWGEIHELGHNQQRSAWEFGGHTGEATCNLWSVYVHEEVLGLNRAKAHGALSPTERKSTIDKYVKGGRKLSDWNVWTALETYLQLQEKFGWDAIKKVFAVYHKMTSYPSDNKEKMNLYAVTFSEAVGMNLSGFFKAWSWPIGRDTEEKLFSLPPWSDHPMVKYE
ncbi:TRPM8 channel-associated factor homolog [Plectropomus leopardus]|uniref:TRPM8 channel-associated factor homolog n=1 Tax=Plectropomus leopardus TaxID=160734 RepID=UPI001C4BF703|nr:TRPM8 channel-associated factor homolog [Plectropomus leopardus]XP_042343282.1 TRPM8 channel-associated factor homolog [Plectropomus leopardus]